MQARWLGFDTVLKNNTVIQEVQTSNPNLFPADDTITIGMLGYGQRVGQSLAQTTHYNLKHSQSQNMHRSGITLTTFTIVYTSLDQKL